ncbi:Sulfate transporter [Clonorchis sinensis]|uniref:Sulfate transporter n=1 Tax=Clonorchis sinensis TaxID=79923 RepID=A0A8T1M8V2_CLOSI|nr:Sulfate transporter [Clonorchis sinensis]
MSILHVPQGMAYGYLAGLKPINGLYTSFFPPLVYFFFGTSRHISVGTFSVVALLSATPVDRLAAAFADVNVTSNSTDDVVYDHRLKVAITVTLLSGLIQFLMGLLRLGFLMVYISSPLLGGFTCASALHVIASQLNALFGVKMKRTVGPGILPLDFYNFFLVFKNTNVATVTISVICITVLAIFKFLINPRIEAKIHFPFPVEVVVLILATTISHFAQLNQRFGVRIVGSLPQGLPKPVLPDLNLVPSIAMDSVIVSFVALATTVSLAKLYASKAAYDVQYTLEMNALGLANIVGSFFQCHAASGALARTSVSYCAGMKSQVASLISCTVLLLVLTVIGPSLESVPMCVLSSIILVSLTGILGQIMEVPKLLRSSVIDAAIWIVTFLATVFIDVPLGLITGLVFSLVTVLCRTQLSTSYELGHIKETDLYENRTLYTAAERLPGIVILRFGGPLYYANSERFQNWVTETVGVDANKVYKELQSKTTVAAPTSSSQDKCSCSSKCCYLSQTLEVTVPEEEQEPPLRTPLASPINVRFIVLDISSWTFIDVVGAHTLRDIIKSYKLIDVDLLLTKCQPQVRKTLHTCGLSLRELDKMCFVTLHDAVLYARSHLAALPPV